MGFVKDAGYYERFPYMKPSIRERIPSINIQSTLKTVALSAMLLLVTPGSTQAESMGDHSSEEITQQGNQIASLLRLEIYGIPTFDLSEYTDEATKMYYIQTLDDPAVGTQTGMILRHISEKAGITFGWIDIPNIADLVTAKYSGNQSVWEEKYKITLSYYPSFEDKLRKILTELGYNPFETET